MAISKKLTIVFMTFYLLVILYLLFLFYVPPFREFVISTSHNLSYITEGSNYFWALVISLGVCFFGSASLLFPIPFPFVLFSLSNSVLLKYANYGLAVEQVLVSGFFWLEIIGLALAGGLGSVLGEFTGYAMGYGAKKVVEGKNLNILDNINSFGNLILQNRKRTPLYVFLFALTPLPDDILFLPLGMIKYPYWKCIIPGWLGKNVTTLFYCSVPIFIALGLLATGIQTDDLSNIITEAILLLVTITIMFFIMSFNWNKLLEKRREKRKSTHFN
jgi:membrane protein YqaA with SNARE-associated domain